MEKESATALERISKAIQLQAGSDVHLGLFLVQYAYHWVTSIGLSTDRVKFILLVIMLYLH